MTIVQIGTESVLVVRLPDGSIAARNVCMHRGNRLRGRGAGTSKFSCLFHGWQYALDGTLLRGARSGSFQGHAERLSLRPVR